MRWDIISKIKNYPAGLTVLLLFFLGCAASVSNGGTQVKDTGAGAKLVQGVCASCHKFSGQPESKFNLKGPDLMWGGVKYQRAWLERWLQGSGGEFVSQRIPVGPGWRTSKAHGRIQRRSGRHRRLF